MKYSEIHACVFLLEALSASVRAFVTIEGKYQLKGQKRRLAGSYGIDECTNLT